MVIEQGMCCSNRKDQHSAPRKATLQGPTDPADRDFLPRLHWHTVDMYVMWMTLRTRTQLGTAARPSQKDKPG